MRRSILIVSCLLVFVLGCNLFQSADAAIYDIGTQMESDIINATFDNYYPFTSGAIVKSKDNEIDYTSSIFDGNLSTGINTTIATGRLDYRIYFPIPLFITNITVKNQFSNNSSNFSFYVFIADMVTGYFVLSSNTNSEEFYQLNCFIDSIEMSIYPNGTNKYYFNDVIISYTELPSNNTELLREINDVKNYIDSFQNQINNLDIKINNLKNSFDQLNSTINNLNHTQQQIINDIANLWSFYNELNNSINNMKQDIININSTLYQNLTQIENNLVIIQNDINKIEKTVNNVTIDSTNLTVLQEQLEITKVDITNLNTNLTQLYDSIPDAYDNSGLQARILSLENENAELKTENQNLTTEINNLNSDISDLTAELDTLKQKVDDIEEKDYDEHEHDEEEGGNENLSMLAYGGIGFGIIGIIIALVAVGVALRKKGAGEKSGGEEEE